MPPTDNHGTQPSQQREWRMPWATAAAGLVIVLGAGIVTYPQMASWFSQREQTRVVELLQTELAQPPNDDVEFRRTKLQEAYDYNAALRSGAIYEANANLATGEGTSLDESFEYDSLLTTTSSGLMGRVRYERLDIDLPIYHGTDDDTLLRGVGHLEGTSLPVGGVGTRSVLTAHRGLPSATLFNELDQAEDGDTFTVTVLDEVLTYKVVETQVIEPDETEAILPEVDQDLLTLITCTPLGINTHRILVTGERVTPTPIDDINAATGPTGLPHFPWWAVIFAAVSLTVAVYVWRSGFAPIRAEHGTR